MEFSKELLERARVDFRVFVVLMHEGYQLSKLHKFLLEEMQQVIDGKTNRLSLSTAPRSGKSLLISKLLPAFLLGQNPSLEILSVSYSSSLASSFVAEIKRAMDTPVYQLIFPWARRAEDLDRASEFRMSPKALKEAKRECLGYKTRTRRGRPVCDPDKIGGFFSTGISGSITGKAADFLLIDDPVKSSKEASSPAYQKELAEAWQSDLYTRLEPGARVLVVQTRWHERDLVGIIENSDYSEDWKILNIPALCIDPAIDPLGREIGEAAFPERFPVEDILKIKKVVGEKTFNCLYQQQPETNSGGSLLGWDPTWIKRVDQLGGGRRYLLSWDCASETHSSADNTAVSIYTYEPGSPELVLNTAYQFRVSFPQLVEKFVQLNRLYPRSVNLVEKASNGIALGQLMKTRGYDIRDVSKQTNKLSLYSEVLEAIKDGLGALCLKRELEPVGGLVSTLWEEMARFREPGFHSDLVITYIQALNWYQLDYTLTEQEGRKSPPKSFNLRGGNRAPRLRSLTRVF